MNSEYNKEHIYDSQLKELLDKIDIICRQEQIPYFFTCAIKNDEQDTKYHSEMLSTLKSDRILKNDIIAECLKLLRGYHTTLSANVSTSLKNAENIKLTMSDEDILDNIMHKAAVEEMGKNDSGNDNSTDLSTELSADDNASIELECLHKED